MNTKAAVDFPDSAFQRSSVFDPALHRVGINLSWFLKLRWAAAAGQLVTILVVNLFLEVESPLAALLFLIGCLTVSNAVVHLWVRHQFTDTEVPPSRSQKWSFQAEAIMGSIMALDIVLLSSLLYVSGGPTNPFALFYLVNLSLAAVILRPRWVWTLNGMTIACFALLFWFHRPLPVLGDFTEGLARFPAIDISYSEPMLVQLEGLWIALAVAGTIVVYFITRVTNELSLRESELNQARQHQAQTEKLEALATLAAGAAHELASPLSTIAVVARDLELNLGTEETSDGASADAKLIRTEVARCRKILDQMSTVAGESAGEKFVVMTSGQILDGALESMRDSSRVHSRVAGHEALLKVFVPREASVLALRSIIKNALDASEPDESVEVSALQNDNYLSIAVRDHGSGMDTVVLSRAADPFFTTKEPGEGMGLGLFLARAIVERLGGELVLSSRTSGSDRGTTAEIRLPLWQEKDESNGD